MGRGGTHPRERRVRRRDVKSRKPENPEKRRIGADTVGKLTICTANAGPTDLPECEKLKILKSAESAPPIGPPKHTPRDHPDHQTLESLKVEGVSHPKIESGGSGGHTPARTASSPARRQISKARKSRKSENRCRYSWKVDDLYSKRRPDGFAGVRKVENPEICRIGAPRRPPETYPPRPPRPPDSEKFESRGGLPPDNRVRWVGGAHTRKNGGFAGETSSLESPKFKKNGESVPIFLES